ncbi:ABC transporter permease [Siminovitchia sp. FSL H7-0308]|uniref:ABC transport system permease protein n=1 Tax=Siminovitchia thermophila TaxID=1245522 RepID=A0ABS2RAD6_9BACI|nr:ABC transporter permease [Siminovitchia thermophila]MBM7716124.1 putative ABC transport system permease protein [Siminovitchia thermophila]ONK22427.1 macrolide export ATP-binding/permease MacB [Bacillus sp. VT-16-64]
MSIWESFKIALSSIWNHKIRSLLTMLGIIIGVAAVIIIVAIGQGAKTEMTDELFSMDKNIVELYYEEDMSEDGMAMMTGEQPELSTADIETLAEVPGVEAVLATNMASGSLLVDDEQVDLEITGVGSEFFSARDIQVVEGRPLNQLDNDGMNRVLMIDTVAKKKLFKDSDEVVGEVVDVNDNPYKIVGVYESPVPEQFRFSENGEALMPRSVVSMMFGTMEIESLAVIANNPERISEIGQEAADTLTEAKGLEEDQGRYAIFDFSEYEKEFNTVITVMTLFIGSIAAISLLVGGIGVMNIMLVSVTERTREIGLRKALGATRGKILLQFLIESITLTSLGGLLGISLAFFVSMLISIFAPINAIVSPLVVLIGVGFSAFIGVIFGILPANKASKLSPIDALRYE